MGADARFVRLWASLRRNAGPLFLALGFTVWFVFAAWPPHYTTFTTTSMLERLAILATGVVYHGAQAVLGISILLAPVVFGALATLLSLLWYLWRSRRWPTLIPVVVLLAANWLVFGAFGYVRSPHVGERIENTTCPLFILDADTMFRMVRYPVDVMAEVGERQFILVSHDGGNSWQQVVTAYRLGVLPTDLPCDFFIVRQGEEGVTIAIERRASATMNKLELYESLDRGRTWHAISAEGTGDS